MSSKLDKLRTKIQTKKELAIVADMPAEKKSEISIAISRIKSRVKDIAHTKVEIARDLSFLQENQEQLKEETGLTFKEFIEQLQGFSKSYFYQLTNNYKFLQQYNKIELLENTDTKVIELISKVEDPKPFFEKLEKGESITRTNIHQLNPVRPSDSDPRDLAISVYKKVRDLSTEEIQIFLQELKKLLKKDK